MIWPNGTMRSAVVRHGGAGTQRKLVFDLNMVNTQKHPELPTVAIYSAGRMTKVGWPSAKGRRQVGE